MTGWISLDEKMPEPGVDVIIQVDGYGDRMCIAHWNADSDWWFTNLYGSRVFPVRKARWHPLPPREEGE